MDGESGKSTEEKVKKIKSD